MSLAAGVRLGPYEIQSLIGAGGMGEVYRARDTRLDRTVAVKVLPSDLAGDPDRRHRFEREARAISSLTHAHICTLYDVGEQDGTPFLVMEYLEGESLSERLAKGRMALPQALEIAIEIADALAAAHKHGIVHRDLKPGNVMLTKSGVKLLDFGLAKWRGHGEQPVAASLMSAATLSGPLTAQGTIVGTLQYMAPEQIDGREADARTDLFALGAIVYEMVAGRRAFVGQSPASLMGAILEREPAPLATLQPVTPPSLDRLVQACLAKDPDARVQNAHDLAIQLQWAAEALATSSGALHTTAPWHRWLLPAAAILALAAAAAAWAARARTADVAARPVVRFEIPVPPGRGVAELLLSPDARHFAYIGYERERVQVYLRALDEREERPIAGSDRASSLVFSPDGRWLGFLEGATLKRVSVAGGASHSIAAVPMTLAGAAGSRGAAWGDDGTIVIGGIGTGLWRVAASGGQAVPLTKIDRGKGEAGHQWPVLLPGSRTVLFATVGGLPGDFHTIEAVSLETGTRRTVLENADAPIYLPGGYLVFSARGELRVVRFDAARAEVVGESRLATEDISPQLADPGGYFTLSRAGDLAYLPLRWGLASVVKVDANGLVQSLGFVPSTLVDHMSLAPDGRRLLLCRWERRGTALDLFDVSRGVVTRLAGGEGSPHAGVWSPDGERILFSANLAGARNANIFAQAADGSGTPERLAASPQHQDSSSWSRDGRWVVYAEMTDKAWTSVWKLDMTTRKATPFRATNSAHPAISPNGRWIAYDSDESGRAEVYVEEFPAGGKRLQLSATGGGEPLWSFDGGQLFYRQYEKGALMRVTVTSGTVLSVGTPTRVFDDPFIGAMDSGPAGYAVAPDGQHFYFFQETEQAPAPQRITVVLGWIAELRTRIGGP